MRCNRIESTNYQAKQRFIPQKTNKNIKDILYKMNNESIVINDKKAYLLKSVSLEGNKVLYDNRTSVKQPAQIALFNVGTQAKLVIDTESGEIIDSNKSFFSTWKSILQNVNKSVEKMLANFENEKIVKRDYLTVEECE